MEQTTVPEPPTREIVYRIASTEGERRESFELVYTAYRQIELIPKNPFEMRVMPFHLLPTTHVFLALYMGRIICTVTLVQDGELGIPMDSIFEEEVEQLRAEGSSFGEVSCLADRRRELVRTLPVFVQLTRLMAQFARTQGMDRFLIAVHPKHARFYKRFMGFQIIGDERSYPTVQNRPAVACCLDFDRIDHDRPACYDQFFGERIAPEQLVAQPMPADQVERFRPVAEHAGCCVSICTE